MRRADAGPFSTVIAHRWFRPALLCATGAPFVWLAAGTALNMLGADPVGALIHYTGQFALILLCATLAVSPLCKWLDAPALARSRTMLGLSAFFYSCVHLLCYAWLDQGLDLRSIAHDFSIRTFLVSSVVGFVLMALLAATSFKRAVAALGAQRWKALHRSIYVIALLSLYDFFEISAGRRNLRPWIPYAIVLTILLGWRVLRVLQRRAAPLPRDVRRGTAPPSAVD